MKGICEGTIIRRGISRKVACEYVRGQSPKGLPVKSRRDRVRA
jgi:hypothetical protein